MALEDRDMSVSSLPGDVLREIFAWIAIESRALLLPVSLVSHAWHAIAQHAIDRCVDLTICSPYQQRNLTVLDRLRQGSSFRARVQQLIIRDVHTSQRVPLGLRSAPFNDLTGTKGYFSDQYEAVEPFEPGLQSQIDAVCDAIRSHSFRAFTWTAIPPLPRAIRNALATQTSIRLDVGLNRAAIATAAWSRTPVANRRMLEALLPVAGQLRRLELCLPEVDKQPYILQALDDLLRACTELHELKLHALGRPSKAFDQPWTLVEDDNGLASQSGWQLVETDGSLFPECSTQSHDLAPFTQLEALWPIFNQPGWTDWLSLLSLENFCICTTLDGQSAPTPSFKALRTLTVSCLQLLQRFRPQAQSLKNLSLTLAGRDADMPLPSDKTSRAACCRKIWPESEAASILTSFSRLQELKVHGNVEAVSVATLMSLSSLETLALLSGVPIDHTAVASLFSIPPPRRLIQPQFIASLGEACPSLKDLTCDAPNASVELDSFLDSITTCFPALRRLSIHRSPEPYGDEYYANKLSWARFTTASAHAVWRVLRKRLPIQQLVINIGHSSRWDSRCASSLLAPKATSRTIVVQASHDTTDCSCLLRYLEKEDAYAAVEEDRPGPWVNFWAIQHDLLQRSAEEHNKPVFPEQSLCNGSIHRYRCPRVAPEDQDDPEYQEFRERKRQQYVDALQAQHDAQVMEALHPTRDYY